MSSDLSNAPTVAIAGSLPTDWQQTVKVRLQTYDKTTVSVSAFLRLFR